MKPPRSPRAYGAVVEPGAWPAAPHDPRGRVLVTTLRGWEVRVPSGVRATTFVPRAVWPVQLWSSDARVSILTPATQTRDHYEVVSMADGWKMSVPSRGDLVRIIARELGPALLHESDLERVERWLVPFARRAPCAPSASH